LCDLENRIIFIGHAFFHPLIIQLESSIFKSLSPIDFTWCMVYICSILWWWNQS